MKISILSLAIVALSALALAHHGENDEDHGYSYLPSAISVSLQTVSGDVSTLVIFQGTDSILTTTLQPLPTGTDSSSPVSSINSILTDSFATPSLSLSPTSIVVINPGTTPVLSSPTIVSSTIETLVSPTGVSTTTIPSTISSTVSSTISSAISSAQSSSSTTPPLSTSTATGEAPIMCVGFGGLVGVAAGVLAVL